MTETRETKIRERFEAYVRGIGGGSVLRAKTGEYVFSQAGWLDWQAAYAAGREDALEEAAQLAYKMQMPFGRSEIGNDIRSLSSKKEGSNG